MFTTSYVGGGGWGNPSLLLLPAAIVWVPSLTRPPILLFWRKGLIFIFVASYGTEYTEKYPQRKLASVRCFLQRNPGSIGIGWSIASEIDPSSSSSSSWSTFEEPWKCCAVNFSYFLFIYKSKTFFCNRYLHQLITSKLHFFCAIRFNFLKCFYGLFGGETSS